MEPFCVKFAVGTFDAKEPDSPPLVRGYLFIEDGHDWEIAQKSVREAVKSQFGRLIEDGRLPSEYRRFLRTDDFSVKLKLRKVRSEHDVEHEFVELQGQMLARSVDDLFSYFKVLRPGEKRMVVVAFPAE